MARRGSELKMTNNEFQTEPLIQKQRVSVFDRLGPKSNQNPCEGQSGADNMRRNENNYPDRRHRAGGKQQRPQQQNPPRERHRNVDRNAAVASTPVQVHLKPNALLHRTLQDVKKERTKEALVTNPAAAIEDLEQRLQRVEEDRIAAEELSNALLLTQQKLLQDKAKLQAENMQLKREMAALKERLEYLDIRSGGCSPRNYAGTPGEDSLLAAGGYEDHTEGGFLDIHAEEQHQYQAITPDSGMLRALKMNAAAAADLGDVGEITKKLEIEEIC